RRWWRYQHLFASLLRDHLAQERPALVPELPPGMRSTGSRHHGIALCRPLAFTQPLATGLAMLARIRQAQGDAAGVLDTIGQAEQVELSPQVTPLLNPVPAWRAAHARPRRGRRRPMGQRARAGG